MITTILKRKASRVATLSLILMAIILSCTSNKQNEVENAADEVAGTEYVAITEDLGSKPWTIDIQEATVKESYYRKAIWTGEHMQLVLMSLKPGEKIDLELHSKNDQFFRVESGEARVQMGETEDNLSFDEVVSDDFAILIPAGYWHQITNIGDVDLKLYTIYGPPEHEAGTTQATYEEAQEYEHHHHH